MNEQTWGEYTHTNATGQFFQNNNKSERFVRLVVLDHLHPSGQRLYDSHTCPLYPHSVPRINAVPEFNESGITKWSTGPEQNLIAHARVPINFEEWYFIVATYNPSVDEENSFGNTWGTCNPTNTCDNDSDYWRGNIDDSAGGTAYSGFGAKCKVEIISKTDLLRARGYTSND